MKKSLILLALTVISCTQGKDKTAKSHREVTPVEVEENVGKCQAEINIDAGNAYKKADEELNHEYQSILKNYKDDPLFIENLKKSHRIWLTFRDAEIQMKYPEYPQNTVSSIRDGSAFDLCYANFKTELTEQRTATLKAWNIGCKSGDYCSGSIKYEGELRNHSKK